MGSGFICLAGLPAQGLELRGYQALCSGLGREKGKYLLSVKTLYAFQSLRIWFDSGFVKAFGLQFEVNTSELQTPNLKRPERDDIPMELDLSPYIQLICLLVILLLPSYEF